jgi:hypothetical protein
MVLLYCHVELQTDHPLQYDDQYAIPVIRLLLPDLIYVYFRCPVIYLIDS